jgi:hypothetical protein
MTVDELNNATSEQLREYMSSIDRQLEVETDRHEFKVLSDLWWKCRYKAEAKEQANVQITPAIHPWRATAKKDN